MKKTHFKYIPSSKRIFFLEQIVGYWQSQRKEEVQEEWKAGEIDRLHSNIIRS